MSRILLSSPFFSQPSANSTEWPDLSIPQSCRAQASWLPLPPHRSMLRSSKSAAAAALFSSLRAASRLVLQRSRSENAVGPTCQAATTTLDAFHFRQVLFIRCSPRQTSGGQAQHSRASPPQTSERRTGSAARAATAPDERRPSSLTQPIPSGFSLCFWRRARSLYVSFCSVKVSFPVSF